MLSLFMWDCAHSCDLCRDLKWTARQVWGGGGARQPACYAYLGVPFVCVCVCVTQVAYSSVAAYVAHSVGGACYG